MSEPPQESKSSRPSSDPYAPVEKVDLTNPPHVAPQINDKYKMSKPSEPCAGCLQKITGDNWDVMFVAVGKEMKYYKDAGAWDRKRTEIIVHSHQWCKVAAKVRLLRDRAAKGLLTGPEYQLLRSIDATPPEPHAAGGHRISASLEALLTQQLFPAPKT